MTGTQHHLNTARVLAALLAVAATAVVTLRDLSDASEGLYDANAVARGRARGARGPCTDRDRADAVRRGRVPAGELRAREHGRARRLQPRRRAHAADLPRRPGAAPTVGNVTMDGVAVTRKRAVGSSAGRLVVPDRDRRLAERPLLRPPRRDGRSRRLRAVRRPAARASARTASPSSCRRSRGRRTTSATTTATARATPGTRAGSTRTVRLGRPFLNRGVPNNFRRYDLPFLAAGWRGPDATSTCLAQSDLEASSAARARSRVRPDRLPRPPRVRDDARVRRRSRATATSAATSRSSPRTTSSGRSSSTATLMEKTKQWRDLGRPEAALLGVQYRGNDRGEARGSWVVRDAPAASLAVRRHRPPTRRRGSERTGASRSTRRRPPRLATSRCIAEIPNLFGPGFTAQMTYYETRARREGLRRRRVHARRPGARARRPASAREPLGAARAAVTLGLGARARADAISNTVDTGSRASCRLCGADSERIAVSEPFGNRDRAC